MSSGPNSVRFQRGPSRPRVDIPDSKLSMDWADPAGGDPTECQVCRFHAKARSHTTISVFLLEAAFARRGGVASGSNPPFDNASRCRSSRSRFGKLRFCTVPQDDARLPLTRDGKVQNLRAGIFLASKARRFGRSNPRRKAWGAPSKSFWDISYEFRILPRGKAATTSSVASLHQCEIVRRKSGHG